MDRADGVLSEAVERARAADDRAAAADARVALADLRFQVSTYTGVGRQDVLHEVDAAIQAFEEVGDEAGLARALTVAGQLRLWGGEAAAAVRDLERAARHARDAGDGAQEADSLRWALTAMRRGPTPAAEALARCEETRSRVEVNRRLEVFLFGACGHLDAMLGHFDAARDLISQAKAAAEEHGLHVLLASYARPAAGLVELLAGDPRAAERELRAACEGTEELGELGFLASIVPHLVDALLQLGRDEDALLTTDRWRPEHLTVPEDTDAQVGWRRVRAKVLARKGNLEEAECLARESVAIASRTDLLDARAQALADLGEVLSHAERPEESAQARGEAIRLHEQKGNVVAAGRLRSVLAELTAGARASPTSPRPA